MLPEEVYDVAQKKGMLHFFHANSLATSISLLKLNSLASRKHVESSGLAQTVQYTDDIDKSLGVWNDVFLDTVDIHRRASRRNNYGPILFVFDSKIILSASGVRITKTNPSKWQINTPIEQRYFTSIAELDTDWNAGNFDQMITLQTPNGAIPFDRNFLSVIIDDPATGDAPSKDYIAAEEEVSKLTNRTITRRQCTSWCKCKENYQSSWITSKMFSI
ncbi:hypothetical protein [Pseudomonas sp. MF6768]|uniref:hypothetical protein n=1 Tax=Pseudomonas sp. MF6768 TaxID=2797532 RepID=UPI0018E6F12A|nr:hypothetical protein [Pseudomonas sp. MF6768]MBJ2241234.1 hypothetical protein [Pseudomonas sp. MF6768]